MRLPIPKIGRLVRLSHDYHFDPMQCIRAEPLTGAGSAYGNVINTEERDHQICRIDVKLIEHYPELDDHDNCLSFYSETDWIHPNGFEMSPLMAFHYYCEYIDEVKAGEEDCVEV